LTCEETEILLDLLIDEERVTPHDKKRLQTHLNHCTTCRNKLDSWKKTDKAIRDNLLEEDKKHPSFEDMRLLAEGNIQSQQAQSNLKDHLRQCKRCRKIFNELRQVDKLQNHLNFSSFHRKYFLIRLRNEFRHGFSGMSRPMGLKFFLAACLVIFSIIVIDHRKPIVEIQEAERTADKKNTEAFDPAPYLEGLLAFHGRASEIRVLSPRNDQIFKESILFSWESPEIKPLFLIVLSNRGEPIRRIPVEDNQYKFKEKLEPGLYYWKLESAEEMLYVGKFLVI